MTWTINVKCVRCRASSWHVCDQVWTCTQCGSPMVTTEIKPWHDTLPRPTK